MRTKDKEMKDNKRTVKFIVNDSERWSDFSNDRLAECIKLCVDTRNSPTEENIDRLNAFQLIKHTELDENKKRRFRMAIGTYKPGDELLNDVFSEIRNVEYPSLRQVQEAVIILNSLYNTNLQNVITTSRNIKNQIPNLLRRINERDLTVIDDITRINQQGEDAQFSNKIYSFATKFCSFINPSYPIFDRFSSNLLFMILNRNDEQFPLEDLGNYRIFCEKYEVFQNKYSLDNNKNTDTFLWMYGKILAASGDIVFETVSHINQ